MIFNRIMSNILKSKTLMQPDYEACIELLNTLQSNASYIQTASTNNGNTNNNKLLQVQNFCERAGLTLNKLDKLSVIHVAGTKGKGTTCAFSESILRHHGFTTGFFSSPHLFEVRERIRINGKPIDKQEFASYFWKLYSQLDQTKLAESDMPLYFRFLTILAFSIFLDKNIDVAIIEVGIGGEYDCTNILRKVPVVGITSLGIDHTSLLGHTIESIAWNKAGIMKKGCQAFTVPQPEAAMKVLRERSKEKDCTLEVIDSPHFKYSYNTSCPARVLNLNSGLAVALCNAWISSQKHNNNISGTLSESITKKALANCSWPGRFQIVHEKNITYYLDGAHTAESIEICSNWFKSMTETSTKERVLIFNLTGNRNCKELLKLLSKCNFDGVVFVTNNAKSDNAIDNNYNKPIDNQVEKCRQHKKIWLELEEELGLKTKFIEVFPTVIEGINFLNTQSKCNLLVTGSLHLIGALLSILDPHLYDN